MLVSERKITGFFVTIRVNPQINPGGCTLPNDNACEINAEDNLWYMPKGGFPTTRTRRYSPGTSNFNQSAFTTFLCAGSMSIPILFGWFISS